MDLAKQESQRERQRKYREKNRDRIRKEDSARKKADYPAMKAAQKLYLDKYPEKRREYAEKYKANGSQRLWRLKSRYGLTKDDFDRLLESQNGTCGVCGDSFQDRRMYVDHDHDDGRVRGIVHMECNTLMGLAKDNPVILEKAATYLRTAKGRVYDGSNKA